MVTQRKKYSYCHKALRYLFDGLPGKFDIHVLVTIVFLIFLHYDQPIYLCLGWTTWMGLGDPGDV